MEEASVSAHQITWFGTIVCSVLGVTFKLSEIMQ